MKILFSFTLQGQTDVDKCINRILDSKLPLNKCRFYYCDDFTKQYLLSKKINGIQIIKSSGLSKELDFALNVMRLSKNKPNYTVIGLKNTKITRYSEFENILNEFQSNIIDNFCIFTTHFMYPYIQHQINKVDSRVIISNNAHKDLMNNYIDTCSELDTELANNSMKLTNFEYTCNDVLENLKMDPRININFKNTKNQTRFQQFFLSHLSDWSN